MPVLAAEAGKPDQFCVCVSRIILFLMCTL